MAALSIKGAYFRVSGVEEVPFLGGTTLKIPYKGYFYALKGCIDAPDTLAGCYTWDQWNAKFPLHVNTYAATVVIFAACVGLGLAAIALILNLILLFATLRVMLCGYLFWTTAWWRAFLYFIVGIAYGLAFIARLLEFSMMYAMTDFSSGATEVELNLLPTSGVGSEGAWFLAALLSFWAHMYGWLTEAREFGEFSAPRRLANMAPIIQRNGGNFRVGGDTDSEHDPAACANSVACSIASAAKTTLQGRKRTRRKSLYDEMMHEQKGDGSENASTFRDGESSGRNRRVQRKGSNASSSTNGSMPNAPSAPALKGQLHNEVKDIDSVRREMRDLRATQEKEQRT